MVKLFTVTLLMVKLYTVVGLLVPFNLEELIGEPVGGRLLVKAVFDELLAEKLESKKLVVEVLKD